MNFCKAFDSSLFRCGLVALALLHMDPLNAQLKTVGRILHYERTQGGVKGRAESAIFDVRAYSEHTIRVRISQHPALDSFAYALADPGRKPMENISLRDVDQKIEIFTRFLTVEIEKSPQLRIIFKTKEGKTLSEDLGGRGFGTSFSGEKVTVYRKLQPTERFVGLGEALGNLDKRGMGLTLNNTDNYRYGDPRVPMYISIPFFIGIHDSLLYGIFYNNSYKSFFNFGSSNTLFSSAAFEGGDLDYFFFYDDTMGGILDQYTDITGRMPLPPKWSIGYHQSRCSYYPQEEVMRIARTMRGKSIPLDCIVLDADYLQDYEPFRINTLRFPDMRGLADTLRRMNIELTASVNPGIKIDSSYPAHGDGLKKDVFLRYADGTLYEAVMEPSLNHWVDFTSPRARTWWAENLRFLPDNGIHGYWNDMNEPAVTGQSLPDNLVFDFDGRKTFTAQAKNVYGMQMARASFESALQFGKGRRPFVLSRSGFAGIQRYAAVWSGDNQAKDEFILQGVLLNCQMGLSGIPFTGPDLGGYIGDGNKELYKRWVESGVFSPFVRNHREAYAQASEPWAYGEEAESLSRTYISFRYRLLPYIYSTFHEASRSGMPIARSLCLYYPFDPLVYDLNYQYQYLFGDALMVVPLTSQEKTKKIYFPPGEWYDLFSDEKISGGRERTVECPGHKLPLYVRASAIIPMQKSVQSTKEDPGDTLFVHIYAGTRVNAFLWYEDDGATMDYMHGQSCRRTIKYDPMLRKISFAAQEGEYRPSYKVIQLELHGFEGLPRDLQVNGRPMGLSASALPLLDPLADLAAVYDPAYLQSLRRQEEARPRLQCHFAYTGQPIDIRW